MNLSTADLRNYWTEFHETFKSWWYRTMLNFYPPFLFRVLADILKMLKTQNCSSNGDLSLCQILCFFPQSMNLSTADLRNYWTEFHETWWSYRYMFLVDPRVFSFVVKGVKVIFWGVQRGWYQILMVSDNVEFLPPIFYAVLWQPFKKW
jgi:hypothetical protein